MKKRPLLTPARAQKIQDEIFNQMTDDQKFELWAKLWQLGKMLNPHHFEYDRPARASHQSR